MSQRLKRTHSGTKKPVQIQYDENNSGFHFKG